VQPLRSLLFVPGNKPAWMEKALGYGADALVFDLEDAVPATDKAIARPLVREALTRFHTRGPALTVRVNALETGLTGDDLETIVCPGLSAIVAPKIETPQDIAILDTLLTQCERRAGLAVGQVEIFPTMEAAARQGTAAVTYQGGMVDIAMVKTAQQILALARVVGATD
jgi:citrate lyase subunit beta/citryl-CoA lyase